MTNQIENHSQNEYKNNLYEEMNLNEVISLILKKKLFVGIITLSISIFAPMMTTLIFADSFIIFSILTRHYESYL